MMEMMLQVHSAGGFHNNVIYFFLFGRKLIFLKTVGFFISLSEMHAKEHTRGRSGSRSLTNGMPLFALSSKNLDGLKKLPYSSDHFLRLV